MPLDEYGLTEDDQEAVISTVLQTGTCQGIDALPEAVGDVFVVSADISAEEHVRMQAAMQAFVDNSLSKTINFPADASRDEVAEAYQLAWELGCKGITVYVTGSREKVVLETKVAKEEPAPEPAEKERVIWNGAKKARPSQLSGYTFKVDTPVGKAFVTVNQNGDDQPFEVFLNTAKAGSETAAVSEAIGRLISYNLRLSSPGGAACPPARDGQSTGRHRGEGAHWALAPTACAACRTAYHAPSIITWRNPPAWSRPWKWSCPPRPTKCPSTTRLNLARYASATCAPNAEKPPW